MYLNITITTQANLSFVTGQYIQVIHDSSNYIYAQVVSYNSSTGSLTFLPIDIFGSGTYTSWTIICSGASGTSGTSGTDGTSGTSGATGTSGASGTSGTSGSSGTDGTSGSSGFSGTSGTSGIDGTSGSSGTSGTSGTDGVAGTSGSSGTSGTSGVNGTNGTSGTSGATGTSGASGTSGTSGTSGSTPNPNARTETTFTATAGQTVFTVSYTVGQVDVYYNGSKLAPAEFTATNGTSITLAIACQVNDIVNVVAYITGAGVGGGGSAGQVSYFSGGTTLAGTNNLFWDNTNVQLGIGTNAPSAGVTSYSTVPATQFKAAGVAPAFTFSNTLLSPNYGCVFGLATSNGHFVTGTAPGDMAIANQSTVAGAIVFGTGTTERMRMTSAGTFSIGNTNTTYKLDVTGTGRFTDNVGIGAAPLERLTIAGSNGLAGMIRWTDLATSSAFLGITSGGVAYIHSNNNALAFGANGSNNFAETMRLTGGNVGIGTTNPTSLLEVKGATPFIRITDTSVTTETGLIMDASGGFIRGGLTINYGTGEFKHYCGVSGNGYFQTFHTNGSERFRISSTGTGLFATTTASAGGFIATSFQVGAECVSKGTYAGFFWENRSGGVTSNSNWYGFYTTSGTIYLYNGSSNIASINTSSGAYTALSDINKKKDFEQSKIGLNAILGLKPTLFRMKSDDNTIEKQLGFIAQEVKEFIPQAYVETKAEDKDGGVHIGLNYQAITAALVKAIQELEARLKTLENK